jgi:hypothetical protein
MTRLSVGRRAERQMRPLYDASVRDLGPGDLVQVECTFCRHSELLTAAT